MNFLYMLMLFIIILFVIHEFEEIILINPWKQKYKKYIESLKAKGKNVPFNFSCSTSAIATGILEEFIIFFTVTIVSCLTNSYFIWYGLFGVCIIHYFIHIFLCVTFKKYVPGFTTSIVFIPFSCFMFYKFTVILNYTVMTSIFSIFIGFLILLPNLLFIHKAVHHFDYYLDKYGTSIK